MNAIHRLTLPQITLASAGIIAVIIALAITLISTCDREDTPVAPEPTSIVTPEPTPEPPQPDEPGPLEILAPESLEITVYDIQTYLRQNPPEKSLEHFNDLKQGFSTFGIDLETIDHLVVAVLDCCSYNNDYSTQKIYLIDGPIDLDVLRTKMETENFEPLMDGNNEVWIEQDYAGSFQGIPFIAATYIPDKEYFAIGTSRGIKELIYELTEAPANTRKTHIEQALALIGNDWKASGRIDAQTKHTLHTHCAHIGVNDHCDATAYYTNYNADPLRTRMITTYFSPDDAQWESSRLDLNIERGPYYPVQIRVANVNVRGAIIDATIEHREPLERIGYGDSRPDKPVSPEPTRVITPTPTVEPFARLEPDPSDVGFQAEPGHYKEFTVRTSYPNGIRILFDPDRAKYGVPKLAFFPSHSPPTESGCPWNTRNTLRLMDGVKLDLEACKHGTATIQLVPYHPEVIQLDPIITYTIQIAEKEATPTPE